MNVLFRGSLCAGACVVALVAQRAAAFPSAWEVLYQSGADFSTFSAAISHSLHYDLKGVPQATGEDHAIFNFSGPVTVATVNPETADWQVGKNQAGYIAEWRLRFDLATDKSTALPLHDRADLSSTHLRLVLDDGSLVTELLDRQTLALRRTDKPVARKTAVAPTDAAEQALPFRYSMTGCMGVQVVSSETGLSGRRGVLCSSGTLDFPRPPSSIMALKTMDRISSTSNFTLLLN